MVNAHKSESLKVWALIPARGGSKGLPRKNVLDLKGKPLIAWTIEAALDATCITRTLLSSDDEEIMQIAEEYGCEVAFRRPAHLASDISSSLDVVLHLFDTLGAPDYLVLLQPTSPLRSALHIDEAFEQMQAAGASSCVSICSALTSPYLTVGQDGQGRLHKLLPPPSNAARRQDLPNAFELNGAIYIVRPQDLQRDRAFVTKETFGYIMPQSISRDIDTMNDFNAVSRFLDEQHSDA